MEDIYVKNNNLVIKSCFRTFDIKWDKISTVEDIKTVLKGLNIQINIHTEKVPEQFEELFKKDFLIEKI